MINQNHIIEQTRRLSLLFVEDSEPLRTRMVSVLEDYFYLVDSAVDGEDGLEKYNAFYNTKQKYYDLVLSDIRMPRMNGVELVTKLRAIHSEQPIIILSAHTETDYLLSLINIGVAQFITKPVQYPEMFDTLYKVCSKINAPIVLPIEDEGKISLTNTHFWENDKKLLFEGKEIVALTKYEILLMELLIKKFEQVCSTDEILSHFYLNNIDVSSDNLRGMMMRLRKKLPDKTLTSIYGMGYRLSAV
ncbi:MAG: response regulator transcription factor [Sulfuricurvum sp.]|nr:response regulator transcription factor [Sulfuricurvum sp.]